MVSTPNIVMIVLDDLGYSQLGCFGSEIETPNIDALASQGLRYNNFHVTAVCSSTRASIITGRNHHAVGMGFLTEAPMNAPGYTGRVPLSAAGLPRILRDSGYNTIAVGKWHLTPREEQCATGPFTHWPLAMGFERYYGCLTSIDSQWFPTLVQDNGFVEQPSTPDQGYHVTEDFADQAIQMVQNQKQCSPNKPFFLYFATGAPHAPHHVAKPWIDKYSDRFNDGWEALRDQIFLRQKEYHIVPSSTALTPRPEWVQPWSELSSEQRRVYARQMEVYAGFVTHTDAQIGRLIDFLRKINALDNTLVLLCSDNGASAEGGPHGTLDRAVGTNQLRNPDAASDEINTMLARIDDFGGLKSVQNYAWGWAWAGNTPFRLWKRYAWLGGVRVPLVVHWPNRIPATNSGAVHNHFCHAIDLMPTILEATGSKFPDSVDGITQMPVHGRSILNSFENPEGSKSRTTQYFEMMGSRAIYHAGWRATTDHVADYIPIERRLVSGSTQFESDRWHLFHTDSDFSEMNNLEEEHPEKLRELIGKWWHEAGKYQVLPLNDSGKDRGIGTATGNTDEYSSERTYLPHGLPAGTPKVEQGFVAVAKFELGDEKANGIICQQGDWHCGWALYAIESRLKIAIRVSHEITILEAEWPINCGSHVVRLEFEALLMPDRAPSKDSSGPQPNEPSLRIYLNGSLVGASQVVTMPEYLRWLNNTKLSIGHCYAVPMCDEYSAPFRFTGTIDSVSIKRAP